jgi:hypothetical protein
LRVFRLKLIYAAVEELWLALGLHGSDPDRHVLGRPLFPIDECLGCLGQDNDLLSPKKYSRAIEFIAAHVAMVSCSSGASVRGSPSIMGSSSCLT